MHVLALVPCAAVRLQVTFAFYAGVAKREMNPALVFTALALFNSLRIPLMMCKPSLPSSNARSSPTYSCLIMARRVSAKPSAV